eukprot:1223826-Amphidinium_carterae.1
MEGPGEVGEEIYLRGKARCCRISKGVGSNAGGIPCCLVHKRLMEKVAWTDARATVSQACFMDKSSAVNKA